MRSRTPAASASSGKERLSKDIRYCSLCGFRRNRPSGEVEGLSAFETLISDVCLKPKLAPSGAENARCDTQRGQPCIEEDYRQIWNPGFGGKHSEAKEKAVPGRGRQTNIHVLLYERPNRDSQVLWR